MNELDKKFFEKNKDFFNDVMKEIAYNVGYSVVVYSAFYGVYLTCK